MRGESRPPGRLSHVKQAERLGLPHEQESHPRKGQVDTQQLGFRHCVNDAHVCQ